MRLTVGDDGIGRDARGHTYWRSHDGCWLRAIMCPGPVSVARMPPVFSGSHARLTHVAYRYGSEDRIYLFEAT